MITKEVLQKSLEGVLKKKGLHFTRLRTPANRFRGVRYPADYVLWLAGHTCLVECKQRQKFPIAPSDIRQLPFMKEWCSLSYMPDANYLLLTATEEGYGIFTAGVVVSHAEKHKGLTEKYAFIFEDSLDKVIDKLEGCGCII